MRLLPGGDEYPGNNSSVGLRPLDAQSLVRFNFYAPHVKRLTLVRYHQSSQGEVIWDRLLGLVVSRPVLPNLEVLDVFVSTLREDRSPDPVSFIGVYLSSTLVQVNNVEDMRSFAESRILYQLVGKIAQECPRIDSLRLGGMTGPIAGDSRELGNSLGRLCNLRVLGLGPVALTPEVLTAIGSLANLESLEITEEGNFGISANPDAYLKLPHERFPALRRIRIHVYIHLRSTFELLEMIWSIPSLVRRLTSVSVRGNELVDYPRVCNLVQTIRESSPFVSDFVDCLAQLPLRRLYLAEQDNKNDNQCCSGQRLALAFPNMEDLEISGRDFTFEDLTFIARHTPKLQLHQFQSK